MKTLIRIIIILIVPVWVLSGCSYKEYAKTKQEFARTESIRMQNQGPIVMQALQLVLKQMGGGCSDEDGCEQSYLINHTYYDDQGRKHELKVADSAKSANMMMVSMQFLPVLERIYQQQQLEMEAPPTAEGIALSFIKQLPALGAIWGFTELGRNAGTSYNNVGNSTPTTTYSDSFNTTTTNTESMNGNSLTP